MVLTSKQVKNIIINMICHVTSDGHVHKIPYLVTHVWLTIQTLVSILDPNSILYSILMWSDLSTFAPPAVVVIICFVYIIAFLVSLICNFARTDSGDMLKKPSTIRIFLAKLQAYLHLIGKSILMTVLLRSSLLVLQNPSGFTKISYNIAIVNIVFYLLLVLPLALFISSNSLVLTAQVNKKLLYMNIYLITNLMRVVFIVMSVLAPQVMLLPMMIYVCLFIIFSIKQPVITFDYDTIIRGLISSVAYYCICRLFQIVHGENGFFIEVCGLVFFIAFMNWVSTVRIKYILQRETPSIHQFKILLFLIHNIDEYQSLLAVFALHHYRKCKNPICKCPLLIEYISSKSAEVKNTKMWYEFVQKYIDAEFKHEQLIKMPESQIKIKMIKLIRIVVDISEIMIFVLNQRSSAYYNLTQFSQLLRQREIFSIVFTIKQKIILYAIQSSIQTRYKEEGVINKYADDFINFQIAFQNYRRLLIKSAEKTKALWTELTKKDPDEAKLHLDLKKHYSYQRNIKEFYTKIIKTYPDSLKVLEPITLNYYNCVLNIDQNSPLNLLKKERVAKPQNDMQSSNKPLHLSENMQCFSYTSNTPLCFVSVHSSSFGKITNTNVFFNQLLSLQDTSNLHVSNFIIPEIFEHHNEVMKKFVMGDSFIHEHKSGYLLDVNKNIVICRVMLQIIPSLEEGLKYVFFVKKHLSKKMLVAIKNNSKLMYSSHQFNRRIKDQIKQDQFHINFNQNVLQELSLGFMVKIQLEQNDYYLKMVHQVTTKQGDDIMFVRFTDHEADMDVADELMLQAASRIKIADAISDSLLFYNPLKKEQTPNGFDEKATNNQLQTKQKVQVEYFKVYSIIDNDAQCRNINRWHIFIIVIAIAFLIIVVLVMTTTQTNCNNYQTSIKIYNAYDDYIMLMVRLIKAVRLENYNAYAYSNNSTMINEEFWKIKKYSNILDVINKLAISLPISQITQLWSCITINSNGSLLIGSENNFLTISDFIQNPVTNIINNPPQSLQFSIYRPQIPTPYNQIMIYFWEAVLNGVYIIIPNIRALRKGVIQPYIFQNAKTYNSIIIIAPLIFVLIVVFVVVSSWINWRIKYLKDQTYRMLELMTKEQIYQKINSSLAFCKLFSEYEIHEYLKPSKELLQQTLNSMIKSEMAVTAEQGFNNIMTMLQQQTERNFENTNLEKSSTLDYQASRFIQEKDKRQKKTVKPKKRVVANIFSKTKKKSIIFKYLLFIFPIFAYFLAFIIISTITISNMVSYLSIQGSIIQMKRNINLIQVFSFQLGVDEPALRSFTDIPTYLNTLISSSFTLERFFINNIQNFGATGQQLRLFANKDLCQQFVQLGITEITDAPFDLAKCYNVSGGVLSKGFYPALIGYLESANTLVQTNLNTTGYNMSQRMEFYQSEYHAHFVDLIPYIDVANQVLTSIFLNQFYQSINHFQNTIILISVIMIIFLFILFVGVGIKIRKGMFYEIAEIKSIFSLISYQTMVKNEDLSGKLKQNLANYNFLK